MSVRILHNPRCSKSRQTLALLEDKGVEPEVIRYLENTPSADDLRDILGKLGISARELLRKRESEYKDLGLKDPTLSEDAIIEAMVQHPKLIERPIVINGDKAALGRPPEFVLEIL